MKKINQTDTAIWSAILREPVPESAAVVYATFFCISYLSYPLCLSPQLDALENLILAKQIHEGTLAVEPFYRGMFYPWLLSLVPSANLRPIVAVILGFSLHICAAFQVRSIAGMVWKSGVARRAAFLLYILNPVTLFFSLQVMDMTLGIVFFLEGIRLVFGNSKHERNNMLLGGFWLGMASITRPHFLPAALLVPIARCLVLKYSLNKSMIAYLPLLLVLMSVGGINYWRSGEFRILPWQGPYNLYAANRPGSNGLYLKQQVDVSNQKYMNPARAESQILFTQDTGEINPSIDEMNGYWRNKTVDLVINDTWRLFKLGIFKAYALINSYEQYSNITYSYHKANLPLLRYNPLNWGLIFILSMIGLSMLWQSDKRMFNFLVILMAAYSISLLLYYLSARYRLPLVPLITILAAGVIANGKSIINSKSRSISTCVIFVIMGVATFSSFAGIRDTSTYIQDRLLLANANADLGNDFDAARLSKEVLLSQPERNEALRIYTVSYFNLQLLEQTSVHFFGSWEDQKNWVIQHPDKDPVQNAILGVYHYKWGNLAEARNIWTQVQSQNNEGSVLASACIVADSVTPTTDPLTIALRKLLNN